ncbi:hypothetical protein Rsub_04983 [Raphidocelis subcapitata]|uniref:BZIP domain-containing protein n=1 Tax=Raphidocelis subcapitata TaxID=307507 RepID=A0A2V0NW53_9CHLO|nr:hypothetical protein Rsub_04983 [Raphidocelis subcapitata]|eukprot:GBF91878.1 hypothetical protein Rsub_04983 [Raphidocelis subcapitata]
MQGGRKRGAAAEPDAGCHPQAGADAQQGQQISVHEAKLRRQQELNKAAQQRYRQRRKERQSNIQATLDDMQARNSALAAQLTALQSALTGCPVAVAAGAPAPLQVPGLPLLAPAPPAPALPGPALAAPVLAAPVVAGGAGCAAWALAPGAGSAQLHPQCWQLAPASAASPEATASHGSETSGPSPAMDAAPPSPRQPSPATPEAPWAAPLAALRAFESEHGVARCLLAGDALPPAVAAELAALVSAAVNALCALDEPPGAGATPAPIAKEQWLSVLAGLALSDGQMRAVLEARDELLAALAARADERRSLAQRLLAACDAAGPGAAPLPLPLALQTLGYEQGAVRASLAARDVVSQLRAGLAADADRLRAFASRLLTAVLSPEQAALVLARAPALEDIPAFASTLAELFEMASRLGLGTGPSAAAVAAAAAAAGASMKRGSGRGAPAAPPRAPAPTPLGGPILFQPPLPSTAAAMPSAQGLFGLWPAAADPGSASGGGAAGSGSETTAAEADAALADAFGLDATLIHDMLDGEEPYAGPLSVPSPLL